MNHGAIFLFYNVSFATMTPIKPSIRMKKRPVHIGSVPGEFEPAHNHLALVRYAVPIGIGQLPDSRWRCGIKRLIEPYSTLWKGHFVGEDSRLVVNTIIVCVGEKQNAVGQLFFQPSLV